MQPPEPPETDRKPDWVVIIQATWSDGEIQREALALVRRRGLRLAGDLARHERLMRQAETNCSLARAA